MIEIWTDTAPGERRAALVENGKIVEIHLQRDLRPILGQQATGRLDRKTPAGGYIVDGSGRELLIRKSVDSSEGSYLSYEIIRGRTGHPISFVKPLQQIAILTSLTAKRPEIRILRLIAKRTLINSARHAHAHSRCIFRLQ